MLQIKAKIVYNKKLSSGYFRLILEAPAIARSVCPGQFLEIKADDSCRPLLRRPFSVHRVNRQKIEVLYQKVGPATELLSGRGAGGYLDIIGPLGSGFRLSTKTRALIVGGGIGLAPLVFLAGRLSRPLVLIGARSKAGVLCEGEFKALGCEVKIATDDGSCGFKGRVTDLLEKVLPLAINHKPLAVYSCGPRPMLKEVSRICKKYNLPAQVSLEEHMACGIGACLGCVVKTKQGFQRVCKDGPVFNADEIVW